MWKVLRNELAAPVNGCAVTTWQLDALGQMFDTADMAGGMGKGSHRGVPIAQRPTVIGQQPVGAQLPRRHVWVTGPDNTGPHPGLVLQWERRGQDWWALCVWVVVDDRVTVQQWLPARLIWPA